MRKPIGLLIVVVTYWSSPICSHAQSSSSSGDGVGRTLEAVGIFNAALSVPFSMVNAGRLLAGEPSVLSGFFGGFVGLNTTVAGALILGKAENDNEFLLGGTVSTIGVVTVILGVLNIVAYGIDADHEERDRRFSAIRHFGVVPGHEGLAVGVFVGI